MEASWLTICCADYIVDAAIQGLAYYTMSCMTNSSFKLARMAGYYKGIQSAGGAVAYGMEAAIVCPRVRTTKLEPLITEL